MQTTRTRLPHLLCPTAALSELSNLKTKNQEEISQLKQHLEDVKEGPRTKVHTLVASTGMYNTIICDKFIGKDFHGLKHPQKYST